MRISARRGGGSPSPGARPTRRSWSRSTATTTAPSRASTDGRCTTCSSSATALRAIAEVARDVPLCYDVVGGGPLAERLASLVHDLGLERVVQLHGPRDSAFVRGLLDRAHLFLLASGEAADGDAEGTPLALMEAQACGIPVVSTHHAGIPEVVLDGRSGLLVPEHDVLALADAVRTLVGDHESWPALGACGRDHVARTFDLTVCTEELLDVYARALRARDDGRERLRDVATG